MPLVLGTLGYAMSGMSFLDSMFTSVCFYTLNVQDTPPNILVELARWTAPIATVSGILVIFSSLRIQIINYYRYWKGDSIAVYGPVLQKSIFLQKLGNRGISGGDRFVKAQKYVMLGNEVENMEFYNQNRDLFGTSPVYLKCRSIQPQSVLDARLRLFSEEETAGRLYWKQYCLYRSAKESNYQLKIVIIGFGKLGEELLTYALQDNLFSPLQKIEYHIFGDTSEFAAIHRQLNKLEDKVVFHDDNWFDNLSLIDAATRVMIIEQDNQTELLSSLLLASTQNQIYVFVSDIAGSDLISGQERVTLYPWREIAQEPEYVLGDNLYEQAKRINLRYSHIYSNTAETEENKESEWQKLSGFLRYSNISTADYHDIQILILQEDGESRDLAGMSQERLELFSELEHMRWCRYYWLNNWTYGDPQNGSTKDTEKRIHLDLVQYRDLTEEEKEKDRENIRVLFSL